MQLLRKLRKPRFLMVYPLTAWFLIAAHTTRRSLHLGTMLVLLGALLRLWANGYVGHRKVNQTDPERGQPKIGRLITAGPYAFIRHPLYFGSVLIGVGVLVIAGNGWFALAASSCFVMIYRRKIREEEETLRHEWPEEFVRYEQAVPRWLPTWRRYTNGHGRWSWQGIVASKELKTMAWTVSLLILLFFRMELLQDHHVLFQQHGAEHLLLLGLLLLLVLSDGVSELRRRLAKP